MNCPAWIVSFRQRQPLLVRWTFASNTALEVCERIHIMSYAKREETLRKAKGDQSFGNRMGRAVSDVYMQRALWPQSGTMTVWCFAPYFSFTYLAKAWPRASRVGPCAIAEQEESKPPSGSMSISPSRYVVGRAASCFFSCSVGILPVYPVRLREP